MRQVPSRYHRGVPLPALHSDSPLLHRHALAVGDGHVLNVEEYGNARGIPALILHGGPGSGCSPLLRRFFDPRRYRMICLDQRGAGGSRPRGSTLRNTTADLLADLRLLRGHLGLSRWFVVGGSWGATLALAHAAAEPDAVQALLLRASFLARREDIGWFFQDAATEVPAAWARFAGAAPAEHRAALLPWLRRVFSAAEPAEQMRAARAWWAWEQALASQGNVALPLSLIPTGDGRREAAALGRSDLSATPAPPEGAALAALVDRYRVQSHYLAHDCWLTAPPLLDRLTTLPQVPTLLLHADDDRICRPAGAAALHERVPHSRLRWVAGAGHEPAHPAMASAMLAALDSYAEQGAFDGVMP